AYQSKPSSGPSKACVNTPYQHTHQFEIRGSGSLLTTGFPEYPLFPMAKIQKKLTDCATSLLVPMSHTCTPADEICAFLAKSASLFRLAPWRSPSLR
ncbi:hypothetical protein, partial [Pseudomonas aeruginosa]|uniref:hypothetical protein n=1 Tax=Pseudomonas aeruginosa TaxID=287 RepID=UPI001C542E0C